MREREKEGGWERRGEQRREERGEYHSVLRIASINHIESGKN